MTRVNFYFDTTENTWMVCVGNHCVPVTVNEARELAAMIIKVTDGLR